MKSYVVCIVNCFHFNLQKISLNKIVEPRHFCVIGGVSREGEKANQLIGPTGLSFDRDSYLYMVDNLNRRIQNLNIDNPHNLRIVFRILLSCRYKNEYWMCSLQETTPDERQKNLTIIITNSNSLLNLPSLD